MPPVAVALVPSPGHAIPDHPEAPLRFSTLTERITRESAGLRWINPLPASRTDVGRVHPPEMLDFLQKAIRRGPALVDPAPTYVTPASWDAALLAAGSAIACTRSVYSGETQRAFALVRPPGHHAEPRRAMGFCLLNNLAIAVRAGLDAGLRRVFIVDFDAHHGNGTQAAFLGEERVGFISTHQGNLYPGTGLLEEAPQARGHIANLPLPPLTGDRAFEQIFDLAISPLCRRFAPEMIFVSAGYDGHWKDPLTDQGLSTRGYYELSVRLAALADEVCAGKIVFVLEGGYDPICLADAVMASLAALAGNDLPADSAGRSPRPEPDIRTLLAEFQKLHGLGK